MHALSPNSLRAIVFIFKVSAVADKNAGLVKIDRKSVEWHRGLIAIPVLEVNSRGVDGLENR